MPISVNYPYILVDGTTADAVQVMANFDAVNVALANVSTTDAPTFSPPVTITGFTAGYVLSSAAGVLSSALPVAPEVVVTNSTLFSSFVMAGLQSGVSTLTPTATGRILVIVCGSAGGTGTVVEGVFQLHYGAGNGPAPGAAVTGTAVGALSAYNVYVGSVTPQNVAVPFMTAAVISGLTVGSPYWIDIAVEGALGVTALARNTTIAISAIEI
jgi:hypothetical protein